MSSPSYRVIIEGKIEVKNADEFYSALLIGSKVLIEKPNVELLKPILEKYDLNTKLELKEKDPLFFELYLQQRLLKDYLNDGELKGFVEEILSLIKNKKKKEEIVNSLKASFKIDPVAFNYKIRDVLTTLKKFDSVDREFVEQYYDSSLYLKIISNGLPFYEVSAFFSNEKPRLGTTLGEIILNPKEITVTAINEDKLKLEENILRKVLGKIEIKSKGHADAYTLELISYLRYAYWGLRSSNLSMSESIGLLPIIVKSVNKPKELIEDSIKTYRDFRNNIDVEKVTQELKDLGWYSIILPQKIQENEKSKIKLNKFFKLGTKIGNVGLLLFSLILSIQTVYDMNGKSVDGMLKELI
ncbi:hypothetical protein [Acidianus brierleyi]|uniref:Uncharacterized protein n=1 Tax=Acidianus brierleyi TaxID=41673 RepID=A0A2U9IGT9_9CREN|nr:hypothetical protein [Acidianus brierleyi]AWR95267.1 hypothetical protein DFR85_12325 [Acidianus brierleyi]